MSTAEIVYQSTASAQFPALGRERGAAPPFEIKRGELFLNGTQVTKHFRSKARGSGEASSAKIFVLSS